MDMNKLAAEIHFAAVAKGFWRVPDAEECAIACLHAEISEAVQADRLGMPLFEIERDGAKPEGVGVELADFCMRLMDFSAHKGVSLAPLVVAAPKQCTLPHLAVRLHKRLVYMLDRGSSKLANRTKIAQCSDEMLRDVAAWLNGQGYNLIDLISAKMEYNKHRPPLHGRRY